MKSRPLLLTTLVLAGCQSSATRSDESPVQKEMKALEGTWKTAGAEEGGKPVPKDKLPQLTFTVHPDGKATVRAPDAEFETQSTIDPTKTPKTIDIHYLSGPFEDKWQYGVYKVDGGRWNVAATDIGGKPEDRPRDFDTAKGKFRVMIWERVKDDK
jgi:uncharacterized protein (TIGR03067 family)